MLTPLASLATLPVAFGRVALGLAALASVALLGCASDPFIGREMPSLLARTLEAEAGTTTRQCTSSAYERAIAMRPHACDAPEAPPPITASTSSACNGSPSLCAVPYDRVVFAATHNAHAIAGVGGGIPFLGTLPGGDNQEHSIHRQLDDGIRGLMIDVGRGHRGALDMCHGGCATLDYGAFAYALHTIRAFLDGHPRETITLMLELTDGVTSDDVSQTLRTTDLAPYVYVKPAGAPWPTLGELGKKLVVFSPEGAAGLVMDYWDHAFENPYHYQSVAAFDGPTSCDVDRGNPNGIFVLNHFLTPLGAMPRGLGFMANGDSVQAHINRCAAALGRLPSFVTVDWYTEGSYGNAGSLFGLVSSINARRLKVAAASHR